MIDREFASHKGGTLARSLAIQLRVVRALLLREILTRFGRHNIGFLWLFVEPMLFTLGVTALWTAAKAIHASDLPIAAFAITGYSSVLLWRNMPNRTIGAMQPNLALLYHRNVRPVDIYYSRLLLEGAGATMSFVFLTLFFHFIGWISLPEDTLQVVGGWLMLAWFGFSVALLLGALSEQYDTVEKLWHPAAYILFPLSGAAFMVDALPQEAQKFVLLLPMVHGVEFVREGFFGTKFVAHYDMSYMALCNCVLTIFGFSQERKLSRVLVPE